MDERDDDGYVRGPLYDDGRSEQRPANVQRDDDYYAKRLRRPSSATKTVWIVVLVVVGLGVALIAAMSDFDRGRGRRRNPFDRPAPQFPPDAGPFVGGPFVDEPFGAGPPPPQAEDDSPEARQRLIGTFFDRLGEAYRSGDGRRIALFLDIRRMAEEITAEVRRAGGGPAADPAIWERGLRLNGGSAWANQAGMIDWRKHEIRQVRPAGPDQVEVVVRIRDRENVTMTIRWWLQFRDRSWRFYDMEDVDTGIRISTLMGVIGASNPWEFGRVAAFMPDFRDALMAFQQQDLNRAEELLQKMEHARFPAPVEQILLMMKGAIQLERGKFNEAIVLFKKGRALGPRMPVLDGLLARAHNGLGQYEEALACIDRYAAVVGETEYSHFERGYALHGLERNDEAADAFRASIAEGIDQSGSLLELLRVLPPGEKGEVGELFAHFTSPADHFDDLVQQVLDDGDDEGLEVLAGVMRRHSPDHLDARFYHAYARLRRGLVAEAVHEFREAWPQLREANPTANYHSRFLSALVIDRDPVAAYHSFPDARLAFRHLTEYRTADTIDRVIQAHRAVDPDDPWILYQTGRMHELRGQRDEAEAAYAATMKQRLEKEDVERVRSAQVYNRHLAGVGLTAYDDLEPKEETFEQLAQLFAGEHALENLEALIAAHRPHRPVSSTLPMWEAELKWLAGDYEAASKLLLRNRDGLLAHDEHRWRYHDRLVRSLVRKERFREAIQEVEREARLANPCPLNLEVLVHAAAGDVATVERLLREKDPKNSWRRSIYNDIDLGPLMRSARFAKVRENYPEPERVPLDDEDE